MTTDNDRIWSHFQNARPDAFGESKPRLDYLLDLISARHEYPRVLNIGIGDGYFERRVKAEGWDTNAIDPDEKVVARLVSEGIPAKVGVAEKLPYESGSLDAVVISEVLEHLSDSQGRAAINEIHRILKTGGRIYGTVPHAENLKEQEVICPHCGDIFHRWGHQRSFTIGSVRTMLSERFQVEVLKRTAFVRLFGRGVRGFAKSSARIVLARLGEPIASPNIVWVARKSDSSVK
jgi:SAM-dependent methyltransferase